MERLTAKLEELSTFFGERSIEDYQRILKALGFYKGPVDGIAGSKTRRAVEDFLRVHSYDIKELQRLLNGFGARLKVDGLYGRKTRAALKAFLERNGITWRGDVEAIEAFLSLAKEAKVKPSLSERERVRREQALINAFYAIQGMEKSIAEDGIEGPETRRAKREVERILKRMGMGWEELEEYVGRPTTLHSNTIATLLPSRWPIFLRELEEAASYKGWKAGEVLAYLEENAERAKAIAERAKELARGSEEVLMHIVLSSLVAEWAYGIPAEYLVALSMAETHGITVYGRNGQGVMQITRHSSVTELRGRLKERVEAFLGKPIGDAVTYALAHRGILWNVLAGAETLLLKLYRLRRRPEEVWAVSRTLAKLYNGHPLYKESFSRRVYAYLRSLKEGIA